MNLRLCTTVLSERVYNLTWITDLTLNYQKKSESKGRVKLVNQNEQKTKNITVNAGTNDTKGG